MNEKINANVSYSLYFGELPFKTDGQFISQVRSSLPDAAFYDADSEQTDFFMREMRTAEKFLHGGGQTYRTIRFFLPFIKPESKSGVTSFCSVLSFFPDSGILSLSFHFTPESADLDSLIVMRQSGMYKKLPFEYPNGEMCVFDLVSFIGEKLGFSTFSPLSRDTLFEITSWEGRETIEDIVSNRADALYGILSGDEGYSFVPRSLVESRLVHTWGSRDFIRIYAFGDCFVFFNLLSSAERSSYLERQLDFGTRAYGGMDAYFSMGSCPLTVNHGIFFSVEYVMMLKSLIYGVTDYHALKSDRHGSFSSRIKATREYRRRVISVLQKAESVAISELGEMGTVLMESQHISPIVDKVKYLLELLEGDLDLTYSERNNRLVTLLTVLGLLLAVAQTITAVMSLA